MSLFWVTYVYMCAFIDRGELHKVAVVGPNATLIEEISLFSAQEPVNNIMLYEVITQLVYCGLFL